MGVKMKSPRFFSTHPILVCFYLSEMPPPLYDTQSSKYLKSQSENFPCVLRFIQKRLDELKLPEVEVHRTDFFSASEAKSLRRSGGLLYQEGLSPLEVDNNPSTYRHGQTLTVMLSQQPYSKRLACEHYECATFEPIYEDSTACHWVAKEFRATVSAGQWETVAEDFGIGLATLREYLPEFTAQEATSVKRAGVL
ncbi:hypothetical protein EXIGLDRAFT_707246 [Exidia glandulosa HHB12029]|uniref:Uncharacterized protein n=1 Tax=Exidia glandulosa HHB12029 TaxID=1314781 RepID=A0A165ARK3_EXIGL|nr:hypothetical protein EXIGLDRAFT_707246 [Exidia glandulosa HHB12029]